MQRNTKRASRGRLAKQCSAPFLLVFALVAQGFSAISLGAEYSFVPSVGLGVFYDSNPGLTTNSPVSSSGAYGNANLGFQYATERSRANLGATWYGARYREEGYENDDEGVIDLRSSSRVTERQTLGLNGEYRRSRLFEQRAQTEPGTGDIRDTDIGLARVTRDYWWAEPRWRVRVTGRNALDLRYRRTESRYDEILDDYEEDVATAEWAHALNPRDDIRFGVRGSRYRSPSADSRSETSTVFVGFGRTFTTTSRMELYVGGAKATEETIGQKYDVTGYVFRAGLSHRGEITRIEGVISRDAHPSGGGRLVASDQIRVDADRAISERSGLWFKARIFRDKVLEGDDPSLDRTYGEIEPGWRWHWTQDLAVSASYRYRQQKYESDSSTAKSNTVFTGLTYSWPLAAISR